MLFNKFNKLKREEVVDAIIDLEKQESNIERGIVAKQAEINELIDKGSKEKSREIKLFYAKKISHLREELSADTNQGMYLLYNIQLLKKLKTSIDDKNFIAKVGDIPLNKLLANQKNLAKFLNKALNTKIASEDIMTTADGTFKEIQSLYEPNEDIYGVSARDDELLAVFEAGEEDASTMPADSFSESYDVDNNQNALK